MRKCYGVDIDKKRKALLSSDIAKCLYSPLIEKADAALAKTYPALKMVVTRDLDIGGTGSVIF